MTGKMLKVDGGIQEPNLSLHLPGSTGIDLVTRPGAYGLLNLPSAADTVLMIQ